LSAISRIGSAGGVTRDAPSSGHSEVDARSARLSEHTEPPRNAKVDEVAKLYEKQFLNEMMKAMRGTVSYSESSKPSMAEDIYKGQLDSQYVESWGDNGGIGLSDLIYKQIMERYFKQSEDGANEFQKHGPIQLTDRDISRVSQVRTAGSVESMSGSTSSQLPLKVEVKSSRDGGPVQVQSPWDAKVLNKSLVDGGKMAVTLEHAQNLRSTVIFDGVASAGIEPGQRISKGQVVGLLSPEKTSFFWNISR
jgi:flagellar protein FlgJ